MVVVLIVAAKVAAHGLNWEALSVNPLSTGMVAANVFLLGFLLADMITALLCGGLVPISQEPFYESLLFTGIISCLLIFLSLLIRDLDNPFGYERCRPGPTSR